MRNLEGPWRKYTLMEVFSFNPHRFCSLDAICKIRNMNVISTGQKKLVGLSHQIEGNAVGTWTQENKIGTE